MLRSLAFNGSAPRVLSRMSRSGVPYAGILLTGTIYLIGVALNAALPHDAFEIVTEFSALGVIGMRSVIMIAHLSMTRAADEGRITRPEFRLPGAPYTNYLNLAFLLVVLVMTWFNGSTGEIVICGIPLIVLALVAGWFAARRNVQPIKEQGFARTPTS